MSDPNEIVLVRHGATEWSASKQHTGRTDIALSEQGRIEAETLRDRLRDRGFDLVLTSPLQRARDTARICGFETAEVDEHLREWDYGEYEGKTTEEIRRGAPGWSVWTGPCPGGESIDEVGVRADQVLARLDGITGTVALFSHGHFLRVFAARWLALPPVDGRLLALDTATLCTLGHERETRVIRKWNV
jgi:broad specificity phosphatase PhoE